MYFQIFHIARILILLFLGNQFVVQTFTGHMFEHDVTYILLIDLFLFLCMYLWSS